MPLGFPLNILVLEKLRAEIQAGLDSLDRGDAIEIEDDEALGKFFDNIEAEVQAELAAKKQPE